ncbi:MAG: Zn-dependent alcohol dehydrogenase [Dehalococcoidia bacterium]
MKAAVLYEYNTPLVVEEIEMDPPKRAEVLVKMGAAGICRSDYHFMKGEAHAPLPIVLGHEGSGTVEEVGEGVTMAKPGDRVVLSFVSNCGHCFFCTTGRPNLCETRAASWTSQFDGTSRLRKGDQSIAQFDQMSCFAEATVVPEVACIPIPGSVPLEIAALIGCCVTTGVGAVLLNAQVEPGSTVAVVGCGGVGLNVIMGAQLVNAGRIIAVDVNESKLEFAMKFGATDSVNPSHQDTVARVRELTGGRGVDYAFEVFGAGETITMAYGMTRKGGTVVVIGIAPVGDTAPIDAVSIVRDEKVLKGCYYGSSRMRVDIPKMVELYQSGRLNLDDLVTRRYSLDQINEAYEDLDKGEVGRGVITTF